MKYRISLFILLYFMAAAAALGAVAAQARGLLSPGAALWIVMGFVFLIGVIAGRLLSLPRGHARADGASRASESGNVFFALFGALGLVGILGAASMTILKGPVAGMQKVTKVTIAENAMIAASKLSLVAATNQADEGDCDADQMVEGVPFSTAGEGPYPAGGGYLPADIGAARLDPWGNMYGYCVWDHGSDAGAAGDNDGVCPSSSNYLAGDDSEEHIVMAIISSGPDKVFQTSCGAHDAYLTKVPGSDDIVMGYTYAEAGSMSGGLWRLKSGETDTAEIGARNIEVAGSQGADAARIGYDADLGMSGVGDFLAIKTDNIYSKTLNGEVSLRSPMRAQSVAGLGAPGGGDPGAAYWTLHANESDIFRTAGNVGIGIDEPTEKLHVDGGLLVTGNGAFGSASFAGNIAMGDHKITGLAAPTANADAATKEYVDSVAAASGGGQSSPYCYQILTGYSCASDWTEMPGTTYVGTSYAAKNCCWIPDPTSGTGTDSNGIAQGGYFVLTGANYNGNLGGLAGANAKCLTELQDHPWKGKGAAGTLTSTRVKAFLCDNTTCNSAQPYTKYTFAVARDTSKGGATFITDSTGRGPGDSQQWNQASQFGSNRSIWTNRTVGTSELWGTTQAGVHCSNWSSSDSGDNGFYGSSGGNSYNRWYQTYTGCSNTFPLICMIHPE